MDVTFSLFPRIVFFLPSSFFSPFLFLFSSSFFLHSLFFPFHFTQFSFAVKLNWWPNERVSKVNLNLFWDLVYLLLGQEEKKDSYTLPNTWLFKSHKSCRLTFHSNIKYVYRWLLSGQASVNVNTMSRFITRRCFIAGVFCVLCSLSEKN